MLGRAVRDADRVEVEEVVRLLVAKMIVSWVGLRRSVALCGIGFVFAHRDVADDPAVRRERQRHPLRREQQTPAGAPWRVLREESPTLSQSDPGLQQSPHLAQDRPEVLDVLGNGRLLAELSGAAVVAQRTDIGR